MTINTLNKRKIESDWNWDSEENEKKIVKLDNEETSDNGISLPLSSSTNWKLIKEHELFRNVENVSLAIICLVNCLQDQNASYDDKERSRTTLVNIGSNLPKYTNFDPSARMRIMSLVQEKLYKQNIFDQILVPLESNISWSNMRLSELFSDKNNVKFILTRLFDCLYDDEIGEYLQQSAHWKIHHIIAALSHYFDEETITNHFYPLTQFRPDWVEN